MIVAPRALGGVELLFLPEGAAVSAAPSFLAGLLTISPCRFEHNPNPPVIRCLHSDECTVPAGKPITRFPQAPHAAWHPSFKTSFFMAYSSFVRYSCWCRRERCFPLLPLILCTLSALSSFSPAVLPLLQVVLRPVLLVEVSLRVEDPQGVLEDRSDLEQCTYHSREIYVQVFQRPRRLISSMSQLQSVHADPLHPEFHPTCVTRKIHLFLMMKIVPPSRLATVSFHDCMTASCCRAGISYSLLFGELSCCIFATLNITVFDFLQLAKHLEMLKCEHLDVLHNDF